MSDRDLDPDCTMADDVTLISQDSQDISHQEDSQEDSQDVMPAAKKLKVTRNLLWIFCWVQRKVVRRTSTLQMR